MTILANFIGINQYADIHISDLTGARRDATALWALFKDTVPEIQAKLLVDSDATIDNVRESLNQTLKSARSDDTVIISFSGHGTHDHRLVTHNTTVSDLTETTISMEEIADCFKETQAKIVFIILDCCFSGGAPARVLESSPIPRGPVPPLNILAGTGRILLAAANTDEFAYELPGTGHGLLTKAVLDVLQAASIQVNISEAVNDIMERVRADAGKIGVEQTPVMLGYVEGGLLLPALCRGENFYREFPETRAVIVNRDIKDLSVFGLPDAILSEWSRNFEGGLNDLQLQAVNEYRILDGESLLVVAPTSSGKTFVGEMAASAAITKGRKALFLLPYRALVNEKYNQFSKLYGDGLGLRVIRCTGDYTDQTDLFIQSKYDLATLTYEMFLNLIVNIPTILNQIGLVVLDEAQFIADPSRGINVELLLTFLLSAREQGINPQIIALSAVIGNINSFDAWLNCKSLVTTERPVKLIEGVLDRSGIFQYLNPDGTTGTKQLLPFGTVRIRRDKPSSQDLIIPLVRTLIQNNDNEKIIIFRNRRGSAEGCAQYLATDLDLYLKSVRPSAELPVHDLSVASAKLRNCLNGGTAFHNTNLSRDERIIVEDTFRDPNSTLRILTATTTVAAGINTPASTVIIAEQEFVGDDGRPFTVAEYKNMAGRAGRLGFNEEGTSIILADNAHQRELRFHQYVMGKLEELNSSFDVGHLETWIIRLLAQTKRIELNSVVRLLLNTYGGYLANSKLPQWRTAMEQNLDALLKKMIALGLVEQEAEFVQLTLLGRACGNSSLSFSSALKLVELLKSFMGIALSATDIMALVQTLPESDNGYTPMMKRGQSEAKWPSIAAGRYSHTIVQALQRNAQDFFDYYARCKRVAILRDWIDGVPTNVIEQRYTTNPFSGVITHGDIRKFADATRYHLRSAYQIASLTLFDGIPAADDVESLTKQLEVGLPASVLDLLGLPILLARGEYLALSQTNIKTIEELWSVPVDHLNEILAPKRVNELLKYRRSLPSDED
ncbi:DEAD/DEAH box helicase [Ferroacidibacillus organovorans]|uniref:DEAD/DEAH box helicase n=1 Tax=Ferroacidibacillus organovorans TaxID=1765683 RepID=A0A101XQP5_9BACL|nr:DEAD/DEAH box helicase [Ferroacidibacillus organovorans]KUO95790.1 DEAD/DEAH box helicase [Ferroacidibacillus organovorans]